MIIIFKDIIIRVFDEIKKSGKQFLESGRRIKACAFSGISVVAIVCSFLFAGATFALKVDYDGKTIATVKDETTFDSAVTLVSRSVNGENVKKAVKTPVFKKALVLPDAIDDNETVAKAIIKNTDEIVYGHALEVNGQSVLCVKGKGLPELVEEKRTRFDSANGDSVSEFVDTVEIKDGYFLLEKITDIKTADSIISGLQVRTVMQIKHDSAIPFTTQHNKTNKQVRGYSKVITNGVDGVKSITETVTLINGEETERVQSDEVVVTEPVTKVIEVGTAKSSVSANNQRIAESSGFIFPVSKNCRWQVSAYYGDGRNHKGIDIAANRGTPLYAVKDGTVVEAGWEKGHGKYSYGNSILIDHGNGIKTRYAHEDQIFVKVGDKVKAGEQIGTIGRTGNATGNHVHFEVIVNGTRVNPAPYIGL